MASIRNRNGKWQVRITRKDQQPIAKSFLASKTLNAGRGKLKLKSTKVLPRILS